MMCIIDFIDKYNGFFMVLITLVYVIATIAIWKANSKSAKIAKEQLAEAKKQLKKSEEQFIESKRLECLPFLQIEIPNHDLPNPQIIIDLPLGENDPSEYSYTIVSVKNVGYGSATSIRYLWDYPGCKSIICEILPINAIMQNDMYFLQLTFAYNEEKPVEKAIFEWEYEDLIGNTYCQKAIFYFNNGDLERCENDVPKN